MELTTSDTVKDKKFSPERAYINTLHSYRNAVLAHIRVTRLQNLARRYSGKRPVTQRKNITQILSKLVHNTTEGAKLSPTLEQLIHSAEERRKERQQQTG